MPGYRLKVALFRQGEEIWEDKIAGFAPEIVKYNRKKIKGEAFYDIEITAAWTLKAADFREEYSNIKNFTMAFATLGTTTQKYRNRRQNAKCSSEGQAIIIPPIYAVVSKCSKTENS